MKMNSSAALKWGIIGAVAVAAVFSLYQVVASRTAGTAEERHSSPAGRERGPHASRDSPEKKRKETRLSPRRTPEDLDKMVGWTLGRYERLFNRTERFVTLDENGQLTEEAIREANLTAGEASSCREIFDRHRQQMQALLKANVVPDPVKPTDPAVKEMFFIKAFPAEGSDRFEAFLKELDGALGEEKRNAVLGGYSIRNTTSYGRENAHVKIYAADGAAADGGKVRIEYYDALNSEQVGASEMPLESFRKVFGPIDGAH